MLTSQNITLLNTVELETYTSNQLNLTAGMISYLEEIYFSEPTTKKGILIQYTLEDSSKSIYHKAYVNLKVNNELLPEKHQLILEEEELIGSGGSVLLKQVAGSKKGIAFIPVLISENDDVRFMLTVEEYSSLSFETLLDTYKQELTFADLDHHTFADLGSEKPQIIISGPKEKRPTYAHINIIYNNANFTNMSCLLEVIRNREKERYHHYEIAPQREMHYKLTEPGVYHFCACVTGMQSEDYDPSDPEKNLIVKEEKTVTIYPPCDIRIKNEKVIEKGKDIEIEITADLPSKPKRCYIGIRKYEPKISLDIKQDEAGFYLSKAVFSTKDLPNGLHIILAEYLLEDGTSEVKSSTFLVREDDNFDVTYFD